MTVLKWISIIVFLLLMVSLIIIALVTWFMALNEIIKIFKKYPEIGKYWFKESSYERYYFGDYKCFKPYTTKKGTIISVSKRDGKQLCYLKSFIEILLFALITFIFAFGAWNTASLLLD